MLYYSLNIISRIVLFVKSFFTNAAARKITTFIANAAFAYTVCIIPCAKKMHNV